MTFDLLRAKRSANQVSRYNFWATVHAIAISTGYGLLRTVTGRFVRSPVRTMPMRNSQT